MTIPNKLTLGRMVLTPVFFILFFLPDWTGISPQITIPIIWIVLILSEFSDWLDGYLARKWNLISEVGKVMDPFADVLSRVTYFLCYMVAGIMPVFAFILILWRELGISFIRMLFMKDGTVLAARKGGKIKAVFYFISGIMGLLYLSFDVYAGKMPFLYADTVCAVLFILAALSSLVSFFDYLSLFTQTDLYKRFRDE